MFRKIVVPVDLSDRHDRTLRLAAELARPAHGDVTLLHVIELVAGMPPEEEPEFYRKLEKAAREHLDRLGGKLAAEHAGWQAEVLYGQRAEVIVRRAAELGADLLLLTSHRVDLERPLAGLGTQSYKIGILAQCSVMLVK